MNGSKIMFIVLSNLIFLPVHRSDTFVIREKLESLLFAWKRVYCFSESLLRTKSMIRVISLNTLNRY